MFNMKTKPIFVNPVVSSAHKKSYAPYLYNTPQQLEAKLHSLGIRLQLGNALKGGFASSQVYESMFEGKPVVIKHTEDLIPFDPTEIFSSKRGHNVDTKILTMLSGSKTIRVPNVYKHVPRITTTIKEDLRSSHYELLHDQIVEKRLTAASAAPV